MCAHTPTRTNFTSPHTPIESQFPLKKEIWAKLLNPTGMFICKILLRYRNQWCCMHIILEIVCRSLYGSKFIHEVFIWLAFACQISNKETKCTRFHILLLNEVILVFFVFFLCEWETEDKANGDRGRKKTKSV